VAQPVEKIRRSAPLKSDATLEAEAGLVKDENKKSLAGMVSRVKAIFGPEND
jgi:hypothetical protein